MEWSQERGAPLTRVASLRKPSIQRVSFTDDTRNGHGVDSMSTSDIPVFENHILPRNETASGLRKRRVAISNERSAEMKMNEVGRTT